MAYYMCVLCLNYSNSNRIRPNSEITVFGTALVHYDKSPLPLTDPRDVVPYACTVLYTDVDVKSSM